MTPLLEQFLSEARDFLQSIGEKLMQLEQAPNDAGLMNDLFRLVHTLKGNSGLFEFPEMTRVLHAGEDLMSAARDGRVAYSIDLADRLLEAMDFVGLLCDEIESTGHIDASRAADSARLAESLRELLPARPAEADAVCGMDEGLSSPATPQASAKPASPLADIPEALRMEAFRRGQEGEPLHWLVYTPVEECFYQGDDPFFQVRHTPDLLWGDIVARESWPKLAELDAYRCVLDFRLLTAAPHGVLMEYYRYVPDQVRLSAVDPWLLVIPQGDPNGGPVYDDFVDDALRHLEAGDLASLKQAVQTLQMLSNPALWLSSALRWLLLLVEIMPDNHAALRILIESFRTLTPPDWTTEILEQKPLAQKIEPAPVAHKNAMTTGKCALAIDDPSIYAEFISEAIDNLAATESNILALEQSPDDAGLINNVFRIFHSIKGTSDMLGLPDIKRLAHEAEFLLDAIRSKKMALTTEISNLLLEVVDHVKTLMENLDAQISETEHFQPIPVPVDDDIEEIKALMGGVSTHQQADAPPPQKIGLPRELSDDDRMARDTILAAQRQILLLNDHPAWLAGRLKAVAEVLSNCWKVVGDLEALLEINTALEAALTMGNGAPLLSWLDARQGHAQQQPEIAQPVQTPPSTPQAAVSPDNTHAPKDAMASPLADHLATASPGVNPAAPMAAEENGKFGRRAEDQAGIKSLKVDQGKIDRLMNLIGEMVVSKNSLPYLAQRAEAQYGVRDLSREIKTQYAVINRITEEMQDAIMQVRMMPVSFVFQRFPRLVRDLSRKFGKEVKLVLEGEETEADKNIIESLADPLVHIVRNSLDHGLETPDIRRASGKPPEGTLTIRAAQEADRVVIEIIDDGKGIDPAVIKSKAYEKGILNEAGLERISDQEAINLVFAPAFSTAAVVTDVSGRGVGMDVVRTAVEKINGNILLESEVSKGTRLRISLPLSMAVTKVMIVESDQQTFGVPMDHVVETVRVARRNIQSIKRRQTTVLRGRIVPLKALNTLLGIISEPIANADDELAVLVVRVGGEAVGLVVDNFRETVDIIQKPLNGVLSGLAAYSGSALMGDGSVLMVLNVKEIV